MAAGSSIPKLFSHKPRKSRLPPTGDSGMSPSTGSPSSSNSGAARRPLLDRVRGSFGILLAANLFLGGYMLFGGRGMRTKVVDEAEEEDRGRNSRHQETNHHNNKKSTSAAANTPSDQASPVQESSQDNHTAGEREGEEKKKLEPEKPLAPAWELERTLEPPLQKPPISYQDQMAVLQWILEEKRKVRPKTWTEKWQIDEEKRLLKDHLRSGKQLPLKDL